MDLTDKLTALLTAVVEPADRARHDAKVARMREEKVQAKENLAAEEVRMAAERAALDAHAQQLQAETFQLSVDLNASNEVMRRRHQKTKSRLPLTLDPRNLFHTPGPGQVTRRRQMGSRNPGHRFSRAPWNHLVHTPFRLIMCQHRRVTSPIPWCQDPDSKSHRSSL